MSAAAAAPRPASRGALCSAPVRVLLAVAALALVYVASTPGFVEGDARAARAPRGAGSAAAVAGGGRRPRRWGEPGAVRPPSEPLAPGFGPFCPAAPDEPPVGRVAYVLTPADSSYVLASYVTAQSLRDVGTVADIVVAYLESEPTITPALVARGREMGLIMKPAPMPPTDGQQKRLHKRFDTSGMKITEPWGLTEYDRVIYLDMDNVVQRNIDHLFWCPDLTAVDHVEQLNEVSDHSCTSCSAACKPQRMWLMSAMMVLRPNKDVIAPILACSHPDIPWSISDMDFINCFYRCNFHRLPLEYQRIDRADIPDYTNATYVVHWSCGRKPFWVEYRDALVAPLEPDPAKRAPVVAGTEKGCLLSPAWHALFWRMRLHKLVADPGFTFPAVKP